MGRKTERYRESNPWLLATWNDPWLQLPVWLKKLFCVVKGHFCSFLISNILETSLSADLTLACSVRYLSFQSMYSIYFFQSIISLKRESLSCWNYFLTVGFRHVWLFKLLLVIRFLLSAFRRFMRLVFQLVNICFGFRSSLRLPLLSKDFPLSTLTLCYMLLHWLFCFSSSAVNMCFQLFALLLYSRPV